jgi:hypothetical protein
MLGWMILCALFTLPGLGAAVAGYPVGAPLKTMSVFFAVLFMIFVLTRMVRGRSH